MRPLLLEIGTAVLLLASSVLISAQPATAQSPTPVEIQDPDIAEHAIGPREAIHLEKQSELESLNVGFNYVTLEVVVSANGVVEEARPVAGPARYYEQAQSIEMQRRFKPFTQDDLFIRARFKDDVSVLPPEQRLEPRVPFPAVTDINSVSMGLRRTGCFGTCPAYAVTIAGNGDVAFNGGLFVLAQGRHSAHISQDAVRDLLGSFRRADFFSAKHAYTADVTDSPTYTLTLTIGNQTRTVEDYVGTQAGLPDAVKDLERQIDETANVERWTKGNSETLPALVAEKWNFASPDPANIAFYRSAIEHAQTDLLDHFLAAHAPFDLPDPLDGIPVCVASAKGNLELVQRMIGKRRTFPTPMLSKCLRSAARGGNLSLLELWIDHGANPDLPAPPLQPFEDMQNGLSPLANGVSSGNPDVVRKLLEYKVDVNERVRQGDPLLDRALQRRQGKDSVAVIQLLTDAGADPNARDQLNRTPLFNTGFNPQTIPVLVAAGAEVNVKDDLGETPLIKNAFIEGAVRELLAVGADPTISAKNGSTALSVAKQFSCQPCAGLIEEALKKASSQPQR